MNYYGLDWIAMGTSLLAVYLLGQRSRLGFVSFLISNVIWIVLGVLAGIWGIVAGNVAFLALNARGYTKWKPETSPEVEVVAGGCP